MERALERTPGSCGIGCNFITMELSVHFCPVSKCTIHPICCEDFGITMLEGNDEYLCISCHVRSLSRSYVTGVLEEAYNDDDYNDNNFAEKIDQASDLNDDDDPDLSPSVTVFIPPIPNWTIMNAGAIYDALNPTEKEKTETKNKPKWTDGAVNSKGRIAIRHSHEPIHNQSESR